jgi:hypothetical protein
VEVLVIHPSVVSVGITYPMHQILELLPLAEMPHVQDGFDFVSSSPSLISGGGLMYGVP